MVPATAAKTVYSHITKDPEVCGGRATIDGTRIRVLDIWSLKQRGLTPEQTLFQDLKLAESSDLLFVVKSALEIGW